MEDQKELFPNTIAWMKMADHLVTKLTDYSSSIIHEIEKLDDAIEKKQGEIKAWREKLEDVQIAIKEAALIHAQLTPPAKEGGEIVDFVPAEAPDETEEEHLRTMDEPGPAEEDK